MERMSYWQTAVRFLGVVYKKNNVLCADCARTSDCYIVMDYIPKLQRSSAQGINQGASCAAALGSSDQGRKMGHNWKNDEFKLLRY